MSHNGEKFKITYDLLDDELNSHEQESDDGEEPEVELELEYDNGEESLDLELDWEDYDASSPWQITTVRRSVYGLGLGFDDGSRRGSIIPGQPAFLKEEESEDIISDKGIDDKTHQVDDTDAQLSDPEQSGNAVVEELSDYEGDVETKEKDSIKQVESDDDKEANLIVGNYDHVGDILEQEEYQNTLKQVPKEQCEISVPTTEDHQKELKDVSDNFVQPNIVSKEKNCVPDNLQMYVLNRKKAGVTNYEKFDYEEFSDRETEEEQSFITVCHVMNIFRTVCLPYFSMKGRYRPLKYKSGFLNKRYVLR